MKILLTGANGYIGRRLKHKLLQDTTIDLRLMVRNKKSLNPKVAELVEVVEGDTTKPESLELALEGVDTAYYLVHSLNSKNYRDLDKLSAQNFINAAKKQGVKRVIYLGGLGEKNSASEHLISRLETGEILSSEKEVQCLWFRAGVIIGSGSASFEIIRNLVQKLPMMITPKWVETIAQPVGVDDVINYLYLGKDLKSDGSIQIDIGSEKMRYKDLMLNTAKVMGLKRFLFPVPFLSPKLSSYWLTLFTPVPFSVAKSLIEGLKSEVVVKNENSKLFDIRPKPFNECVSKAIDEIENNQVVSRWSDSSGDIWEFDHKHDVANALFIDRQEICIKNIQKEDVFRSFMSIGGKHGWFSYDFLWEFRGVFDKLLGGFGTNRGRRDPKDLRIGDSLDFWKVVDIKENERLLLFAQMKVPGKAWLEFKLDNKNLVQSAYFYPNGILGRLYWYSMIPFHHLIFKNMAKEIVGRAICI